MLIYTTQITPRLRYTCELVFEELLGLQIVFTDNLSAFSSSKFPKLNYSNETIESALNLSCAELLFEDDVKEFNPADLSHDKLASIFYLVSRYEEYGEVPKDEHNRFCAKNSNNPDLKKPMVNVWAYELKDMLAVKFPGLQFNLPEFRFIPTYDIDIVYKFLGRDGLRTIGGYVKDLIKLNFRELGERSKAISGKEKDPFDVYDWLDDLHAKFGLNPIYFFPAGDTGSFDRHMNVREEPLKSLIQSTVSKAGVGLHPTYGSNQSGAVGQEKQLLASVAGKEITQSRQHFLMLEFPFTYRRLIDAGIKTDYSMGFHDACGFRAGICSPFYWFDLERNEKTDLRIYPFQVMEATYQYYQQEVDALAEMKQLVQEVNKCNGTFVSLWHNNSLSEDWDTGKWRRMYEELVDIVVNQ